LVTHFFLPTNSTAPPLPHIYDNALITTNDEASKACKKSCNSSTPGPDQIPYKTWKNIHHINPTIIPNLLSILLVHGHDPTSLKAANGVVLPKQSISPYTDHAAFRVKILLKTISKILKRIITVRLYDHSILNKLIHPKQGGSPPGRSLYDITLTLIYEIKLLQSSGNQSPHSSLSSKIDLIMSMPQYWPKASKIIIPLSTLSIGSYPFSPIAPVAYF